MTRTDNNVVSISKQQKEYRDVPSTDISEIYPGFSNRLNQIIDLTDLDIPALSTGRQAHMVNLFEASRVVVTDWLKNDKPPRPATLRKIVVFLLKHLGGIHNELRVEAWLKYGDEAVGNPFHNPTGQLHPLTPLATILVHEETKRLNINALGLDLQACLVATVGTLIDFELSSVEQILPAHRNIIRSHIEKALSNWEK